MPQYRKLYIMKCWRDLSNTCPEDECPMWINDSTTPGLPIWEMFKNEHGMCTLAANAKLDVIQKVLQMAEYMEEDLLFEDEFTDEEYVPPPKKEKATLQTGKKRKQKI